MRFITLFFVSFFILTSSAFAEPYLPQGTFSGTGSMRMPSGEVPGEVTPYTAKLSIAGTTLNATYNYGGGKPDVHYEATLLFSEDPHYFDVLMENKKIGSGYIDEDMIHMSIPDKAAEETLIFKGNEVYRVGSMDHSGSLLIYTETLVKDEAPPFLLQCTGNFSHSDTDVVRVEKRADGKVYLVEVDRKAVAVERELTSEEIKTETYAITPLFEQYDRTIHRGEDGKWVLEYSCGEIHPLECTE